MQSRVAVVFYYSSCLPYGLRLPLSLIWLIELASIAAPISLFHVF